jgi:hypothetical protein
MAVTAVGSAHFYILLPLWEALIYLFIHTASSRVAAMA